MPTSSWTDLLKQPPQYSPEPYPQVVTHPKVEMLPLGTPVRFSHYLQRTWRGPIKVWDPRPVGGTEQDPNDYSVAFSQPLGWEQTKGLPWVDGIVVGHRTLSDGKRDYEHVGYDEGGVYIFTATESYRAYLIAWNVNRAIARVKIEHVEALEDVL